MSAQKKAATVAPLPWYADRRFIGGVLGITVACVCAFAPPQYQAPCKVLTAVLQSVNGGQ